MTTCSECIHCEADDCEAVAFCLSQPGAHPCPHDRVLCEECNIENCIDCRLEAEQDMFRTAVYDPRADPFVDHTAAAAARDDAYWAQTERGWRDLGRGPRPEESA